MRRLPLWLMLAALSAGCLGREEIGGRDLDKNVNETETRIKESRTLSALGKLETSVDAYVKAEGRIPAKIDMLVPKFLGEIPTVELAVRGHKDSDKVQYYPSEVMRGGQVDGMQLRDTGRWGYVFSETRVIIFVDCTHATSRNRPWYQERGVF